MLQNENLEKLINYVKLGHTITDACTLARVGRSTFYAKMEEDPELREQLNSALLEPKNRAIAIIQREMQTTWQCASWWLERKHKEEYALKQHVSLEGNKDAPIEHSVKINDASLEAIGNAIASAKSGNSK